jgi:hypothetical protein
MGIDLNERANPPICTPGYATALSQAENAFSTRSIGSDRDAPAMERSLDRFGRYP